MRRFEIAAACDAGSRCARYTNPVCGLVSSFSTVSCGVPSSDESSAEAETAFLIRNGSATMSSADSLMRELGAVAVGDRAARSRDDHVAHLLRRRGPLERSGPDRAQVRRAGERDAQKRDEDDEEDPDAAVDDGHRALSPGALLR